MTTHRIPFRVEPMLATLVAKPVDMPGWVYEEKYDGDRILAYKEGSHVSLLSRSGKDSTPRFPSIVAAIQRLQQETLLLDGEVVVFDSRRIYATGAQRMKISNEAASTAQLPIEVSHPDKIFWPDERYTKLDLIEYYAAIFPKLSHYVKDRILTLERCPDGMNGECFYAKEIPAGMPPGTPTKAIETPHGKRKSVNYVVGGALETQLALANLGCIAVHVMASRARAPHQPDWVCFDIDPESGKFSDAARAALLVKEMLDALELNSFPKTSGGRGLHILVPIHNGPDASEVLAFAKGVVARVAAAHPEELTIEHSLAARHGRVYLDAFRNGFGQTVAAPYSVRRRPHAPISTPLSWFEVTPELDPADFNLGDFLRRRAGSADPWHAFFHGGQSLTNAVHLLARL